MDQRFLPTLAALLAGAVPAAEVPPPSAPEVELVGWAVLPAETFAEGTPPAGACDRQGRQGEPRWPAQPVQGVSALLRHGDGAGWWALSDNGFGTLENSRDYELCLYRLTLDPRTPAGGTGTVKVVERLVLSDPDKVCPWPMVNDGTPGRVLTGADFDPESLAPAADGDAGGFLIGEEFGPFWLRFDAAGRLRQLADPNGRVWPAGPPAIRAPVAEVLAPQHPRLRGREGFRPTLPASRGFEGLAAAPGQGFLGLLEGTVAGDPPGQLRFYAAADLAAGLRAAPGLYALEDPAHAIGEIARLPDGAGVLVVERDGKEGAEARHKRVYRVPDPAAAPAGPLPKTLVADLLKIRDPHGLSPHGPDFAFPYLTIESLVVLDARTLLICNDNNFPSAGARGPGVPNATEFIWLRLPAPL